MIATGVALTLLCIGFAKVDKLVAVANHDSGSLRGCELEPFTSILGENIGHHGISRRVIANAIKGAFEHAADSSGYLAALLIQPSMILFHVGGESSVKHWIQRLYQGRFSNRDRLFIDLQPNDSTTIEFAQIPDAVVPAGLPPPVKAHGGPYIENLVIGNGDIGSGALWKFRVIKRRIPGAVNGSAPCDQVDTSVRDITNPLVHKDNSKQPGAGRWRELSRPPQKAASRPTDVRFEKVILTHGVY